MINSENLEVIHSIRSVDIERIKNSNKEYCVLYLNIYNAGHSVDIRLTDDYNRYKNVSNNGNAMAIKLNQITDLCKKHNAQNGLYQNRTHIKFNKNGDVLGGQMGSVGGTIVFHSHSCNHNEASSELITLLKSFGLKGLEKYHEVVRTHRISGGTPYKMAQTFIERI